MYNVIKGGLQEKLKKKQEIKERKISLYKKNYEDNLYNLRSTDIKQKAILYGIKYISKQSPRKLNSFEDVLKYHDSIEAIKLLIATTTYRDFLRLFPVIKKYDGQKFECKDYFDVIDYLKDKNLDSIIGFNNVDDFLWNYYNNDVSFFVVNNMVCIDIISFHEGGKSIFEKFLEEIDPEGKIHTFSVYNKEGYIQDNVTGKTFPLVKSKKTNKNLKLVKN